MALPKFYNQGDQDIYNSGQHFISQEDTRLNYTPSTTLASKVGNTGGVTGSQAAVPYILPPQSGGGGGGGDGGGGFGTWGNLDEGSGKWFQVEGHDGPIRGYKNVNTGLYQDKEGLNIQNLGIGSFGLMGMLENAMGWDKKEPKYPGFFQQHNSRDIGKMRKFFEKQDIKKWRASEKAKADEIKADNYAAAAKINPNILSPSNPLIGKIDHTGGGGHGSITRDPGSVVEGAPTHSTRDDLMATGGRIGFQQGGWNPGVGRDAQGYQSNHPSATPNNNSPVVVDTHVNNTNTVQPKAWDEGYEYQTNWRNIFPGGKPFRTYGLPTVEEDEDNVDTNIDIQSPTLGSHLLHKDATARQLEADAAMAALYEEAGWTKAKGGRIGYRDGEFVDEDVNIEGPNFDVNENVEMAETSPFEIRIEELMDEGMSWEEAYNIASQEFSSAEGQGDSFSEEGIASIV